MYAKNLTIRPSRRAKSRAPLNSSVRGHVVLSRTNGWQRIGVVLSVAWLIAACAIVFRATTDHSASSPFLNISSAYCQPGAPRIPKSQTVMHLSEFNLGCPEKYIVPETKSMNWLSILSFTFVPVLLGWAFVLALIKIIQWVAAGFRKRPGSPQ